MDIETITTRVGHLAAFTMTNKKAKALLNTLASSQREVDFETLNNTFVKLQILLRSRL